MRNGIEEEQKRGYVYVCLWMCICECVSVCAYKQPTACSMKMFSLHSISLHYIRAIRLNHNEKFFEYFFITLTFLFLLFLSFNTFLLYYISSPLFYSVSFFFLLLSVSNLVSTFFASCPTLISVSHTIIIYKSELQEVRKEWEKKITRLQFAPRSKRFLNTFVSGSICISKYLCDSFFYFL